MTTSERAAEEYINNAPREVVQAWWELFTLVPIDPDTRRIEASFLQWEAGTAEDKIIRWFKSRFEKKYRIIRRDKMVDTLLFETDSRKEWLERWRYYHKGGAFVRLVVNGKILKLFEAEKLLSQKDRIATRRKLFNGS